MTIMAPLATAFIGYLLFRDVETNGRKARMVDVIVKGKQLTAGFIGEQGSINQPTYEYIKVKAEAPMTKIVYKTPSGRHWNDSSKRVQYGVIEYLEPTEGRATYTRPDGVKQTSKVFAAAPQGYSICEYVDYMKIDGKPAPNNSTGRYNWMLRPSSMSGKMTLEEAKARADEYYKRATEKPEEKEPSEPKPLPPDQLDPSGGLGGFPVGGVGTPLGVSATPVQVGGEGVGSVDEKAEPVVEEVEIEDIQIDTVAIRQSPIKDYMGYRRSY